MRRHLIKILWPLLLALCLTLSLPALAGDALLDTYGMDLDLFLTYPDPYGEEMSLYPEPAGITDGAIALWCYLPDGDVPNDYFYGGAGVEYFPLGNDKVRIHLAYFGDNHDRIHNFDLGLTWRFTAYKRK